MKSAGKQLEVNFFGYLLYQSVVVYFYVVFRDHNYKAVFSCCEVMRKPQSDREGLS